MATDIIQSDRIYTGNVSVGGNLTVGGSLLPLVPRASLAQLSNAVFPINLTDFRVWDALHTNLPGTAATDDLALIATTYGAAAPSIRTLDFKNTTTTAYARALVRIPAEYQAAETVTLAIDAGAITTVASSSMTLDVEAWEVDSDNTLGAADLCATAAQSINNLTFATKSFTITATNLVAGDTLDIRLTIAGSDTATGTAVIGAIVKISLLCDIQG